MRALRAAVALSCLVAALPFGVAAQTRPSGQVIGASNLDRCSWPAEQKRQYLAATQRLARDNASAEIRLETTAAKERREQALADRVLKAGPEALQAIQREYDQYDTHGIPTLECQGSGAGATWVSVVARRKPEDVGKARERIDDPTNRPSGIGDGGRSGDVFAARPDAAPRRNDDICAKSPDSYQCLYGRVQIDEGSRRAKRPPPQRTKPTVVATPSPRPSPSPPVQKPATQDRTDADSGCAPPPDPATETRLRRTGIELLDTMAAMGSQADRALTAMGEAVVAEIAYQAQPNAKVWQDRRAAAKAVVDFFANDEPDKYQRLREAANKAAEAMLRDPASTVGATAAGVLTGKVASGAGAACKVGAKRAKDLAAAARAEAEKAASRMKKLLAAKTAFRKRFGSPCNVNPEGRKFACVPSSWAEELSDTTGARFDESNFRWEEADMPTDWDRITEVQKNMWGDRRFANHGPERADLQSRGIPALMPNGVHDIIGELEQAGDGAFGFVGVEWRSGAGHMFRAGNFGGAVRFRDPLLNKGGSFNFDTHETAGAPVRVYFFRTRGPDLVR